MNMSVRSAALLFLTCLIGCGTTPMPTETAAAQPKPVADAPQPALEPGSVLALATFGNGCFWCTEAVFQQLKGVKSVTSGYSGGTVKNPTYEQVSSKKTGHAEVIQIAYDPAVVSFQVLLEAFWKTHDPTTLNRQGHDVGPQYRSAIFFHTEEQRKLAEEYKRKLDDAKVFPRPIVTEITPFSEFYKAEREHQNFFVDNPNHPYSHAVIRPKLEKYREVFKDNLKSQ